MKMPRCALAACAALALLDCGFGTQAIAKAKYIEFDPPGSDSTYLNPFSLNEKGDVTGWYLKNEGRLQRAFVRFKNGNIIVLAKDLTNPVPASINIHDETVGEDRSLKGFIGAKDGTVAVTFRVPGTDNSGYGTRPDVIDDEGNVAGQYTNPHEYHWHGFLRKKNGDFITFDAPNGGPLTYQGTTVADMNSTGYIVGTLIDARYVAHGFLRAPDGTITMIDASNAGTGPNQGTWISAINDNGAMVGHFYNPKDRAHSFLRDPGGNFIPITVKQKGDDPHQATFAAVLNNDGVVAGNYTDSIGAYHGFVRSVTGDIKKFDAPDAVFSVSHGTSVSGINDEGWISGDYNGPPGSDYHGYLRKP